MTNKRKIMLISIPLAVLLIATIVLAAVTSGFTNWGEKPDNNLSQNTNNINDFAVETVAENNIMLRLSSMAPMSNGVAVSKTLTATVMPESASNKAVDWTCEWADSSNSANVSDYVTVVPLSNGSRTATVTCYQPFSGNIVVTVMTRESGYSATCVVTYVGMPTEINISGSVSPSANGYRLGIGQTYTFDVALSNPFGSVGSQFNNISCGISGVGSMILGYMEHYNASGNDVWFDASDKVVALDTLKDNFITASYANGKLSVTTIKTIESYYLRTERLDSGRTRGYVDKFRSFVDDCYFKVWITENNSGLTKEIVVRFDESVVTGVNVNSGELLF